MQRLSKLSIWMVPYGDSYCYLDSLISRLSSIYDTPDFPPHVTLLGELQGDYKKITNEVLQLASQLRPFTITLSDLDFTKQYFKSLYVGVERTPPLMETYEKARVRFFEEGYYCPHLSLMYGNIPVQEKQKIISEDRELEQLSGLDFRVNSLHLYSTEGKVENWYGAGEFILGLQNN